MARRDKGSGSIGSQPRPDGLWPGYVTLPDGKRKKLTGHTRDELRGKVADELKKIAEGRPSPRVGSLVAEFLTAWLLRRRLSKRGLSPSTAVIYEGYIRLHVAPVLGTRKVASLTFKDLERLYEILRAKGLSESTIHRVHSFLHVALKDAERRGEITRNPCDLIDPPADTPRPRKPLQLDAVVKVLATVEGGPWEAFVWLAVETGLRQGELFGLLLTDINLDDGTVDVPEKVRRIPGLGIVRSRPKTDAGDRTMAIGGMAVAALRLHVQQLTVSGQPNPDGILFPNRAGGYLQASNWNRRVWRKLLKAAGVDETIEFRELTRKAHASVAVGAGVDMATLRSRMGHAQASTTMDHYVKQIMPADRKAANTLDREFRKLLSAYNTQATRPRRKTVGTSDKAQ